MRVRLTYALQAKLAEINNFLLLAQQKLEEEDQMAREYGVLEPDAEGYVTTLVSRALEELADL